MVEVAPPPLTSRPTLIAPDLLERSSLAARLWVQQTSWGVFSSCFCFSRPARRRWAAWGWTSARTRPGAAPLQRPSSEQGAASCSANILPLNTLAPDLDGRGDTEPEEHNWPVGDPQDGVPPDAVCRSAAFIGNTLADDWILLLTWR